MSESFGTGAPSTQTPASSGSVDTAKNEAAELKNTATEQAKDVAGTVKDEATSVAREVKTQAKDLFAQTQGELREQAQTQQQRVSEGLRSVSDELDSMANDSAQDGVAADLVRQVSGRLSGAASWLGDRDPGSVLADVKQFARAKPGTFILGAVIAGVVVGRLTKALASNAADEAKADASAEHAIPGVTAPPVARPVVAPHVDVASVPIAASTTVSADETPIFNQSSPERAIKRSEAGDDRYDSV